MPSTTPDRMAAFDPFLPLAESLSTTHCGHWPLPSTTRWRVLRVSEALFGARRASSEGSFFAPVPGRVEAISTSKSGHCDSHDGHDRHTVWNLLQLHRGFGSYKREVRGHPSVHGHLCD